MNNRPSNDDIAEFALGNPPAETIAYNLRQAGYKFRDSWLREKLAGLRASIPDIPGVVESADVRRGYTTARTLVFTSAQSNTRVHKGFLASLIDYCKRRDAELHISRFVYNKDSLSSANSKHGSRKQEDEGCWFDPAIDPYVSDDSLQLTEDLVWCGELNIIPTMKFPLNQFKTYTRQNSAIIPHAKMAMQTVPVMKNAPNKFLYSTGCCTLRNYIERTAGQVADFHHVFGAMVVEIDDSGNWWARQINATNDGTFYDIDPYYDGLGAWAGNPWAAITHGDVHWHKRDEEVLDIMFKKGGVLDQTKAKEQFFHDIIDFGPRNHHNRHDPHFLYKMATEGTEGVEQEFCDAATFLSRDAYREWCKTFVVTSNHDQAIEAWLRDNKVLMDPTNVKFWHEMNLYCLSMLDAKVTPRPFASALIQHVYGPALSNLKILHEDDSHLILGVIEAALHGHLGPNGARGTPKNLTTVGKANTGHTHSAGIHEGIYTAGVFGMLDMGYNKGLSGWSHSFIGTYPNAKRAIFTLKAGKPWRDYIAP